LLSEPIRLPETPIADRCTAGGDDKAAQSLELSPVPSSSKTGPKGGAWTVSVIIPVHQAGFSFQECLQSIQASTLQPEEVIVVVDGGNDEAVQIAGQFGVRVVRMTTPSGPAAARNWGARLAQGDLLLFIDSDVTIPPTAIAAIVQRFRTRPNLQAVIGSYDDAPSAPNFLSQYKNLLHHYMHQNAKEEGSTFWGACGAIRRDVFLESRGFDERYRRPSIEDIEFGYRLRAAGHRLYVDKQLQVTHHKRWTAFVLFQSDFFCRALPWTALILRSGRLDNDLNIDWASRIKVGLMGSFWLALGLSWWVPDGWMAAALIGLALLALDAPLWRFFQQKRGLLFAVRTIPWHWFYYCYSGLAFALVLTAHVIRRRRHPGTSPNGQRGIADPTCETVI
jgi:GT2 family glycosyltransferase